MTAQLANAANARIRFFFQSAWGYWFQVDDVQTMVPPPPPPPPVVQWSQNFDGTFPPAGWTVVDLISPPIATPVVWKTNVDWARTPNPVPGGTGNSVGCDIDKAGSSKTYDSALVTPVFDVHGELST